MNNYATLAAFKSAGWGNITATTSDTDLMAILQSASRQVDKDTNRFFYLWEGIRYYNGGGTRVILPDDLYSLTTCLVDGTGSGTYNLTYDPTLTPPDFYLYPENVTPSTTLEINPWGRWGTFYDGFRKNIRITGVFGYGNDYPESAWQASGVNVTVATTSGTTLTLSADGTIQIGHTIQVGTEQMFITAAYPTVATLTATAIRGVNGTTAATHTLEGANLAQYPQPIIRATLINAVRMWKRREAGFVTVAENTASGVITVYKGADVDYTGIIGEYRRERFEKWVT